MDVQNPFHVYDFPIGVLPDVFEFVDLFGMLKYASTSTKAHQQIQYSAHNKFHLRLECRHSSRNFIIKEISKEKSKAKDVFDNYTYSQRKELKELEIVFKKTSAHESWHECGNEEDHLCFAHCEKTILIMDNQAVPAIYDSWMEILYVYFDDRNAGFKTLLRHLKDTFQPYLHAADFRYVSNNAVFNVLAMIREEGLTINNFVRSLPERDPGLARHVDELRDVLANNVIVSADPRGVERASYYNWAFIKHFHSKSPKVNSERLLIMKQCENIILEESKLKQEDLKYVVFSWMREKNQLRLFHLLNPTEFDVPTIVDGTAAFPILPEEVENENENILPGQCFRCERREDGINFLIYKTETELVIKREHN